jgi:hypothetical protein
VNCVRITLLSSCEFHENWCREGRTLVEGINVIVFTRVPYDTLDVKNALVSLYYATQRTQRDFIKPCPQYS